MFSFSLSVLRIPETFGSHFRSCPFQLFLRTFLPNPWRWCSLMLKLNNIKMKNVVIKKDDDTSSLGFETTAGGACAVPGLDWEWASQLMFYISATLFLLRFSDRLFSSASLFFRTNFCPLFAHFTRLLLPLFLQLTSVGRRRNINGPKWKRGRGSGGEIDSEVRGLLTFNLQQKRVVVGNDVERSGRRRSVKSVGIKRTKWPQLFWNPRSTWWKWNLTMSVFPQLIKMDPY